jgi:hypothetical protein
MQYQRILISAAILIAAPCFAIAGGPTKGVDFFESKIRPVLSKHCYECHSADARKLKGGLLLDSREGMRKGGFNGPAVVPGNVKDSLLIKALRHEGPKMPKEPLNKEIIADFVKWIEMGAPDPREGKAIAKRTVDIDAGRQFWSFQPLKVGELPAVKNAAWVKTPIDRLILAKLEEKGLTPNGALTRERFIRRATFDLHGLPPTPAEIDAFVTDKAPDAYEKLIDRLLESEHVGERWSRHWLDVVRFAESGGYEFDKDRPTAHHYRDFVIKAFNRDMPFNEFVKLQVAGDHLAPLDFQAMSATGFLVAGPYPGQTTAKTIQLIRYDHLDDMISTLGSSMLGLSLGCARCHEHKYDPIPQEDYYRLIANLSRTDSAEVKVNPDPETFKKAKAAYEQAHAPLVKARDEFEQNDLAKKLASWAEANKDAKTPDWLILDAAPPKGSKTKLVKQPDGSYLATGKPEKGDSFIFTAHTMHKNIKAIRIEALADKTLPKMGPGHGPDGSFVLTSLHVNRSALDPAISTKFVKLRPVKASVEDPNFPLAGALDDDKKTGWSVGKLTGKDQAAVFEIDGDANIGFDGGTILTVVMKFEGESFPIGRVRLSIMTGDGPATLDGATEHQHASELRAFLTAGKEIDSRQREPLGRWLRKFDKSVDAVYRAVEDHAKKEPQPTLVNLFAATANKGGDVHFLVRGEVEKKRELAKPGFVQVLMNDPKKDERWLETKGLPPRVALANWLTDAEHGAGHLLARVIVNRLWQHHMGKGIVGTPNDFGAQGNAPTHPELLDFLAAELIKNGWKLKPIHKLIMTSAVYQQSTELNAQAQKVDPANRLWWRRAPRRLEAEAIRDNILAVAGTLDPKMYGAGTLDANNPRRSIYLTVKRSQMVPFLQMFDVPEGMQSIGERSVTTVPTQSLAFMNSPLVRGAAQKLAARVRTSPDPVDLAYRIALSRRPTEAESERMLSFIERQTAGYGKTPQARDQALTDFCQVLLCLNEFIYVD